MATATPVPETLTAQLVLLESLVSAITSSDPAGVNGSLAAEASERVHHLLGRLEAQRLGWIGKTEAEGSWRAATMHSFASWLAAAEGLSPGLAKRTVTTARALRDHLPATAAAARAGTITAEHVGVMVKTTATEALREALASAVQTDSPAPTTEFATEMAVDATDRADSDTDTVADSDTPAIGAPTRTGEQMLLGLAADRRVADFAKVATYFTVVCDPQAQDKAFKDATEREFLQISPTLGGMQISGFVTTEHGQLLVTALRAVAGVPAAGTVHPADLRRVDALIDLARMTLDGGVTGRGAAVRPHLSVHITWEQFKTIYSRATGAEVGTGGTTWSPQEVEAQLRSGFATWEDGTGPIPDAVLRRIACDCEMTRIIFGPDSQILNVSRTRRTFTKEHRRAIVARDRMCVWPGCEVPPHACEVHHATRHWADGGDTTPSNGALLCRHHHHQVDGENIAMTHAEHGWTIHPPDSYEPGGTD